MNAPNELFLTLILQLILSHAKKPIAQPELSNSSYFYFLCGEGGSPLHGGNQNEASTRLNQSVLVCFFILLTPHAAPPATAALCSHSDRRV
jgi:hypothetical protein